MTDLCDLFCSLKCKCTVHLVAKGIQRSLSNILGIGYAGIWDGMMWAPNLCEGTSWSYSSGIPTYSKDCPWHATSKVKDLYTMCFPPTDEGESRLPPDLSVKVHCTAWGLKRLFSLAKRKAPLEAQNRDA